MVSKSMANKMLFLRIVALASLATTVALLFTNNVKFDDGSKLRFQDFYAYRYEAIIAIIGGAYCMLQLPFAIYYAVQQKRMILNGFLPEFDFYGDKISCVVLSTGVGAGFAVSLEYKKLLDGIFESLGISKNDPIRNVEQ